MSEPEAKSGGGAGMVIGAVIVLLALAAVAVLAVRQGSGQPAKPAATGFLPPAPAAGPVTVKLTALGAGGTWYMIDEDICEGDAALTALLKDRMARDREARGHPADYAYSVRFEVVPEAGITDQHIAAARQAAAAAGARVVEGPKPAGAAVLSPPDLSKEVGR